MRAPNKPSILLVLLLSVACAAPQPGCATPPPSVHTPQGQVAYRAEDAVDAVAILQHEAIKANAAGLLGLKDTRLVVQATMAAQRSLQTAIDNGTDAKAAYRDAAKVLTEVQTFLSPADRAKLGPYFSAALLALTVLGG